MRSLAYLFMLASLACGNTAACLAQQPGRATLEGLVNSGEAQEATTAAEAGSTDAAPKRPAGTVARPKDGVQHPDLDKAWTVYDAAVAKAADGIRAAIAKQFDAATTRGDLDAAERWQKAQEKFEKTGEVPTETDTKSAVSSAVADYKRAKDELTKAYDALVKSLTMEKKITEAKAVREEMHGLLASTPVFNHKGEKVEDITVFRIVPADSPQDCVSALGNGVHVVPVDKTKNDSLFKMVPGLADPKAVSFESLSWPGHFLRHANFRVHLHPFSPDDLFKKDATFHLRQRIPGQKTVSFQSLNVPSHYVRNRGGEVWIDQGNNSAFMQQTAFKLVPVLQPEKGR